MVVPHSHAATLGDLDDDTANELLALVRLSLRVLQEAYHPEGFNIGANMGAAAGAGIEDHFHMHIVPRWAGDTNYMTVVGKTRVIPEWMDQVYERLRPLFDQMGRDQAIT
jgi:ATP adenylyltransferase